MEPTKYILLFSVVYFLQSHLIHSQSAALETISTYEVIDINVLIPQKKKSLQQFQTLDLGKYGSYTLDIYENPLLSDEYKVRRSTNDGILEGTPSSALSYIGTVKGNVKSSVALTINDQFVHGFIKVDQKEINIEPLRYYESDAAIQDIIIYQSSDQEHVHTMHCGLDHDLEQQFKASVNEQKVNKSVLDGCIEVDMAIASDYLMYEHYGSTLNVENHAIAMLNAAQTNYDTEFEDEIRFNLVEQFISECSSCDPWTSASDTETLLLDFREWAAESWENTVDQSSLWSKRDFERNGNTSANGLAFVNTICTSHSSLVVEDNDTANRKRVLFSHELGHNFGAVHDDSNSNFIMSTPLVETNEWSSASVEDINSRYLRFPCLTGCERSQNVVADFDVEFIGACVPVNVQYRNTSFGELDSVKWIFPGGNPTFSTELEPIVNYGVGGTFDVRLEVYGSNGTFDILERSDVISFGQNPISDFTYQVTNDSTVVFAVTKPLENTTYSWDFGDGQSSDEQNPTHVYNSLDSITTVLTMSNNCGETSFSSGISKETKILPQADFTSTERFGCVGGSIQFTNLSQDADSVSWFFEGGTPFNTSEENPIVSYTDLGTFAVGLIAINEVGADTILVSSYSILDPVPVSAFTYKTSGKSVSFTQTSQYARALQWDFGDGTTSEDISPVHTYATAGSYTVSLVVENICQSTSYSEVIQIESDIPVPNFSPSSTELCQKGSVLFRNQSTNASQYQWEFEGGIPASSTEESPIIAYMEPGIFTVKLIASNEDGSTELIEEDLIIINPEPIVDFDFEVNGSAVDFTNQSQHLQSAQWSFGDGTVSTSNNTNHTYAQSGTYEVSLVGANNCGFASISKTVEIDVELPFAAFGANSNDLCAGSVVGFASSAQNANSVKWVFEGGIPETSTSERPSVLYISQGEYNVTLIATNQNGSDTLVFENYISVSKLPVAAFESTSTERAVTFVNQSTDGDTYFWNLGDGTFSTEESLSHTYQSEGTYTVMLRTTNDCGSSEISSDIIIADSTSNEAMIDTVELVIDFSLSADQVCQGSDVTITNLSSGVDSLSWFLNEELEITEKSIQLTNTGINTISLIAWVGDTSYTLTKEVLVEGVPVPDFSFKRIGDSNEISFTNLSTGANNYIWSFGDRFSSAFENPNHVYGQDIPYTVQLTASNSCSSAAIQKVVDLSIKEVPDALFSVSRSAICKGQSITFAALDTIATDFEWIFEGATIPSSDLSKLIVQYDNIGSFDVQLIASNLNGSDTSYLENFILVSDSPELNISYTQTDNVVNFSATEVVGATYSWEFGDGLSSADVRPSHNYSGFGDFEITLTVELPCGQITLTENIQIENNVVLPSGSFSITNSKVNIGGRIRFSSLSKNTTNVEWHFEGGSPETSLDESIIIQYDEAGVFDVTLIAFNEYGSDTIYKQDFITVEALGFQSSESREYSVDQAESLDVKISPNPFIEDITVNVTVPERSKGQFYLFNSSGVLVHKEEFEVLNKHHSLSLHKPELMSGMYIARIIIGEQMIQQKIIKL